MVPPIARNAAYKAGFQPNYNMMAGTAKWTAGVGSMRLSRTSPPLATLA